VASNVSADKMVKHDAAPKNDNNVSAAIIAMIQRTNIKHGTGKLLKEHLYGVQPGA